MSCTECQKRMHFNSNGLEPKGRGGGGCAGGLGEAGGGAPTSRVCPLLAQKEKCMASGCHNSQWPVWVHCPKHLIFVVVFFNLKKKKSNSIKKLIVHSYCPSRPSSPTNVPDGNDHLSLLPKLLNSCLPGLTLRAVSSWVWSHCPFCELSEDRSTPPTTCTFLPCSPTPASSRSSLSVPSLHTSRKSGEIT